MRAAEAESRLAARLEEIEVALSEGRLSDLVKDVPTIDEQLRPYLNGSAGPSSKLRPRGGR